MSSTTTAPPRPAPDYDRLKYDAASDDEATRVRLGAASDTPAELLYFLATDRSLAVRAAVAMNGSTPRHADQRLVRDPDDRVRMVLARKLATLTPGLGADDRLRIGQHAWDGLALLVEDEVARVRAAVADLVKSLPDAPREIILRLAHDDIFSVSDPVLRLSPVLTQEDLLALLACVPAPHTAQSIACRPNLTDAVSGAIAEAANAEAVRCLLNNQTASVRESTLDALIDRSAVETTWHEPLVRRPALSARHARMLSAIVVERLIGVLAARPDLDPGLTRELHERLEKRLAAPGKPVRGDGGGWIDTLMEQAQRLREAGGLCEQSLVDAIRSGQTERLIALIAAAAGVSFATVQRAAKLRSVKAVVSLIWKAGMPARISVPAQTMLCNVGPGAILRASPEGGYPLGEEEMRWQVEFVTRAAA